MIKLFESGSHQNVMFHDMSVGMMVQANQHVIVSGNEGLLLDPGGHKVYSRLFSELATVLPARNLKHIFFSHQDPDIVAAANGWLMMTEAKAYVSELWMRFIPHFGVDDMVTDRMKPIPDDGMTLCVGDSELKLIPAHFLHSCGNFQVYDCASKILYTGDLGASIGHDYTHVSDFDAHVQFMEGFHRRYMPTHLALKKWAAMARTLDIDIIAPQHGAVFADKPLVARFMEWCEGLECGLDLLGDTYPVP